MALAHGQEPFDPNRIVYFYFLKIMYLLFLKTV